MRGAALLAAAAALPALADGGRRLMSAGPLPAGTSALSVSAGRPFVGVRIDRGMTSWLDAGFAVDIAPEGVVRPGLGARARLLRGGAGGLTARAHLAFAQPTGGSYGARPLAWTADAELGLAADLALGAQLGAFAEVAGLIDTDFKSDRTLLLAHAALGLEWSPAPGFSLAARGGQLRSGSGARAVGSLTASIWF